jgi:hypothetical protein
MIINNYQFRKINYFTLTRNFITFIYLFWQPIYFWNDDDYYNINNYVIRRINYSMLNRNFNSFVRL